MNVCSQCLRAIRRQARLEHATRLTTSNQNPRLLHSIGALRQQTQPKPSERSSNPGVPPPIPTTAPTVTSNITADQPTLKSKDLSTAGDESATQRSSTQMQKNIGSFLASPEIRSPLAHKLAVGLRKQSKTGTESYITYGATEKLFNSCAAQAPYTIPEDQRMGVYTGKGPPKNAAGEDIGIPESKNSWWFGRLGLEPTFSTWSQVCFLHMYILTVRLRTISDQKLFMDHQRYLIEHFSHAAEDKMGLLHGMNAKSVRNKYLKELFMQWRGIQYAYDQGIVSSDAVLAGAVWRNLWKASEDVDWEKVALVVLYMRRSIASLARFDIEDIIAGLDAEPNQFWSSAQNGLEEKVNAETQESKGP